jgi:ribulose-5-phosphate 4-epimerase/fuculose-1-phosphate aldolase
MMAIATPSAESSRTLQARIDLAAAHRWAARDGLNEGTWNHFSLVHPEDPTRLLITPSYTHWSHMTASSLVDVGAEYDRAGGNHMDWVAYKIHYPVHQARPDAACVLHVHSPYVTALSLLEDCRLLMASQTALMFHGRIAYNDELDAFEEGLDQGRVLAEALGEHCTALIMRHHGAVVVGRTVGDAYTDMYNLERCCQTQLLAMATGGPLRKIPQQRIEASSWVGQGPDAGDEGRLHFEALKRVLDIEEPGYAA